MHILLFLHFVSCKCNSVYFFPANLLDFSDDTVALYSCLLPQIVPFDRGYIDGISMEYRESVESMLQH